VEKSRECKFLVKRLGPGDEQMGCDVINGGRFECRTGTHVDNAFMERFLADNHNYLVAAIEGDTPIGFVLGYSMQRVDHEASMLYVHEVSVSEHRRREGIGTALMRRVLEICREEGMLKMFLVTGRANEAAIGLYSRVGGGPSPDNPLLSFWWGFEESTP
jgi:ribosomal protein S18 acetylase RimI-like enzyme